MLNCLAFEERLLPNPTIHRTVMRLSSSAVTRGTAIFCYTLCCTIRNTRKSPVQQNQSLKLLINNNFRTSSPPLFRSRQAHCVRWLRGGGLTGRRTVVRLRRPGSKFLPNSPPQPQAASLHRANRWIAALGCRAIRSTVQARPAARSRSSAPSRRHRHRRPRQQR